MNLNNLRKIAYNRLKTTKYGEDELPSLIAEWWSKKYQLPKNSPLLLQSHLEELLIDFFVDVFSNDKKELEDFEGQLAGYKIETDDDWLERQVKEANERSKNKEDSNSFVNVLDEKFSG